VRAAAAYGPEAGGVNEDLRPPVPAARRGARGRRSAPASPTDAPRVL